MDGIGEVEYLAQEIRPHPETLDNAGNLLSPGTRPPVVEAAAVSPLASASSIILIFVAGFSSFAMDRARLLRQQMIHALTSEEPVVFL